MKSLLHPGRTVALVFLFAILCGTALLSLPIAHASGETGPLLTAFFTAVSAVCVTGLVVVDTGTYWSTFGQVVIMALFQLGGFGMMTLATLLGLLVNRSFRLRAKLIAQAESHVLGLGDISSVAKLVLVVTLVMELAVMLLLTLRLHLSYGLGWGEAAWSGLFHAVSAFNNAGFSIHVDGLVRYATDGFILLPVMSAIIIGGIGFPRSQRPAPQVVGPAALVVAHQADAVGDGSAAGGRRHGSAAVRVVQSGYARSHGLGRQASFGSLRFGLGAYGRFQCARYRRADP